MMRFILSILLLASLPAFGAQRFSVIVDADIKLSGLFTNLFKANSNLLAEVIPPSTGGGTGGVAGALTNAETRRVYFNNQLVVNGWMTSTGAYAGVSLGAPDVANRFTMIQGYQYAPLWVESTSAEGHPFLVVSNTSGQVRISTDTYFTHPPLFGYPGNPYQIYGTNCTLYGTTTFETLSADTIELTTPMSGANIADGTINSNKLDTATKALMGGGGGSEFDPHSPGYVGSEAARLWSCLGSNTPVKFLILGDSVAENGETTKGLRMALDAYVPRSGYGTEYAELPVTGESVYHYYLSKSGTYTTASGDAGHTFDNHFHVGDGAAFTTTTYSNGVYGTRISLYYYSDPTYGSFTVQTNLNGGAYATMETISANTTAGYHVTNWTVPAGLYNVKLTSTGSNCWHELGIVNTSAAASTVWANYSKGGLVLANLVTNVDFVPFLTNYAPDVILVESVEPFYYWTNVLPGFETTVSNNLPKCDIVYITAGPGLNNDAMYAESKVCADVLRAHAHKYGRAMFDKFNLLTATNRLNTQSMYTDATHMNAWGANYIGGLFAEWMGITPSRMAAQRIKLLGGGTSGTASIPDNVLTNSDIRMVYLKNQLVVKDWITSTGSLGGFGMQAVDDATRFTYLKAFKYAPFWIENSTLAGAALLKITNSSGQVKISTDPAFIAPPILGSPENPYQLYGTNVSLLGTITGVMRSTNLAASPSAGKVLTAGSGDYATWETPTGGSSTPMKNAKWQAGNSAAFALVGCVGPGTLDGFTAPTHSNSASLYLATTGTALGVKAAGSGTDTVPTNRLSLNACVAIGDLSNARYAVAFANNDAFVNLQQCTTPNITFRYSTNSPNWFFITYNGTSGRVETDTGVAATTNFVTLGFTSDNAGNYFATIDGTPVATNNCTAMSGNAFNLRIGVETLEAVIKRFNIRYVDYSHAW